MKKNGFMNRNFKKVVTVVMAASLAMSGISVSAAADVPVTKQTKAVKAKVNVPEDRVYITSKEYKLAPGATETVLTTNNVSGTNQRIGFISKIDAEALTNGTVKAAATYKNYEYDGSTFGMQTVTDQAKAYERQSDAKVVAAINASFYDLNTGEPSGAFVMNGRVCKPANGAPYFAILKDGTAVVRSSADLSDVQEAVAGNMQIVTNGQVTVEEGDYQTVSYSRTAIGVTAEGDVITYVTHGISVPTSCGESYVDVAKVMIAQGCTQVVMLDGGGSATYASLREGETELTVKNNPSDGTPRTVSTAFVFASTATSDGVFDHAVLTPNREYYTPTTAAGVLGLQTNDTTVQFSATGVDFSGATCALPEGLTWEVDTACKDLGQINAETGLFTAAKGALGEVTVHLLQGTNTVGSTTIILAEPEEIAFSGTGVSLDFSEETDLGLTVKGSGVNLNYKDGDFTWTMDNAALGTITNNKFTAAAKQDTSIEGNITVSYTKADGTKLEKSIFVEVGKMPIVAMDFEDVATNERGKDIVGLWDWGAMASWYSDAPEGQKYAFQNYEILYYLQSTTYASDSKWINEIYATEQPWTEAEDGTITVTFRGKTYTATKCETYGQHGEKWIEFTDETGAGYFWRGYTQDTTWSGNYNAGGGSASAILGADGYKMYVWHANANKTSIASGELHGEGSQIVDASEGEVRFGEYALKLTYDFRNFSPLGGTKNCNTYYRMTDPLVASGSPSGLGMWVYAPESMDNFWFWTRVHYWTGSTWSSSYIHFKPAGADKTCQYTGVNWTGWTYVEADLSAIYDAGAIVDAEHPVQVRSGESLILLTYIPGGTSDGEGHAIVMGSKTKGEFYIDNIRWVYGTNVDDMDSPQVIGVKANDVVLSAEQSTTLESNDLVFDVNFTDPQGENYSGIDEQATQLYLDGSPLSNTSDYSASADRAQTRRLSLANGEHTLLVSICDNFGNRTEQTYTFIVANAQTEIPVVSIDRAEEVELGSDYVVTISTDKLGEIATVETSIVYGNTGLFETTSAWMDNSKFYDDYGHELVLGADGKYRDASGNVVEEPVRPNATGYYKVSNAVQTLGTGLTGTLRNKTVNSTTRAFTASAVVGEGATGSGDILTFTLPVPSTLTKDVKLPISITVNYTTKDGSKYSVTTGEVRKDIYAYYTVEPDIQVAGAQAGTLNVQTADGKAVNAETAQVLDGTIVVDGSFDGNVFTTDYFVSKAAGTTTQNVVVADTTNKHYSYATNVTVAEAITEKDGYLHYDVSLNATSGDSTTTEEITWLSAYGAGKSVVAQYMTKAAYEATEEGTDPFAKAQSVAGSSELRYFATEGKAARVNAVEITGLTPGTAYVFRVGDGTAWSEVGEFSTMSASGKTKFLAMADVQLGSSMSESDRKTLEKIGEATPDINFGIQTGDFTDNPDSYVEWDNILQTWSKVFKGKDFVRVIGNHEVYGTGAGNSLAILGMDADQPDYYSVEYGDVYVAVVNQTADLNEAAEWLVTDAAQTDCTWKVLSCHQPIYFANPNGSNDGHHKVLKVACDRAGIDFTFSGHDHSYVRTEQIKAGKALALETDDTTNAYVDAEGQFVATQGTGTVYYVCGDLGEKSREDGYKLVNNPDFHFAKASQNYDAIYILAEADDKQITINTWNLKEDGTSELYDTFTMYNGKAICAMEDEHVFTQDNAQYKETTGKLICERCGEEVAPAEISYTGFAKSINGEDSYGDSQYYFLAGAVRTGFFTVGEEIWYANAAGLIDHKTENKNTNTCTENGNRTAYSPRYDQRFVGGKVPFTGHDYETQEGALVCRTCGHTAIDIADWNFALSYTSTNYNGTAKYPAVTITNPQTGEKLVYATDGMGRLTDYTRVWSNNKNVGTATVIVAANPEGDYTNSRGDVTLTLIINPPLPTNLKATDVTQTSAVITWNQAAQATGYKVYKNVDGKWRLIGTTAETSYKVEDLNCGQSYEFTVKSITEKDSKVYTSLGYAESANVTTLAGTDISKANVTLSYTLTTYNGNVKAPTPTVVLDGITLERDKDYTVERINNVNAGTGTVIVKGKGRYIGEVRTDFTIAPQSLANAVVTTETVGYTGADTRTTVTVTTEKGTVLTEGTDYTVAYNNNNSAGQAQVVVTGIGNYKGTVKATYTITAADISGLEVLIDANADLRYTGKEVKPAVTVGNLVEGKDYTVTYSNNTNVGTATVTITGIGGYANSSNQTTFQIIPAALPTATLEYTSVTYSGTAFTPAVTIAGLNEGTDYTVVYENNIEVGTASVVVTGKGNYTGTQTLTFIIREETYSKVTRLYGASRFETAMNIADELKAQLEAETFDAMILATGEKYADALTGSYLSYVKEAPILLIDGRSVDTVVAYINENLSENGTLYVLGGTGAVKEEWLADIATTNVKRISGATRYETNIEILKAAGVASNEILVCKSDDFADSISASAAKRPILLVGSSLTAVQKAYLETLSDENYVIIGGTKAVSDGVKAELTSYGATERISGATRYETSVAIAEKFAPDADAVVIACGMDFPDGLCGGLLAAKSNVAVILSGEGAATAATEYVIKEELTEGYVLGGSARFTDDTIKAIFGEKVRITDKKYKK